MQITGVVLRIEPVEGATLIEVLDDGPGIPDSEREQIFQPFARADESRNRNSGGVGLGLAIVKRIMDRHSGSIDLSEGEEGKGARFITKWPHGKEETLHEEET